jgi:hypothetical protein
MESITRCSLQRFQRVYAFSVSTDGFACGGEKTGISPGSQNAASNSLPQNQAFANALTFKGI